MKVSYTQRRLRLASLFVVLMVGAGCASLGGPVAGTGSSVPYPAWVKEGSHLQPDGQDKTFVGLGAVRGIRNVALARSTADNRARAELARLLDAYVAAWVQDAPEGAGREGLLKLLTATSLSGVQIVEHYFNPDDGSVYSLAKLNLSHVVQRMQAQADLPTALKKVLALRSDDVYNRFLRGHVSKTPSP